MSDGKVHAIGAECQVACRIGQLDLVKFMFPVGLPEQQEATAAAARNTDDEIIRMQDRSPGNTLELVLGTMMSLVLGKSLVLDLKSQ